MSNENNDHLKVGEIYVHNYFKGKNLFEECRKITRITQKAIYYNVCGRDGVATDGIEYRAKLSENKHYFTSPLHLYIESEKEFCEKLTAFNNMFFTTK